MNVIFLHDPKMALPFLLTTLSVSKSRTGRFPFFFFKKKVGYSGSGDLVGQCHGSEGDTIGTISFF